MEITLSQAITASPTKLARVLFDPLLDPLWFSVVKRVERISGLAAGNCVGETTRRIGAFGLAWVAETSVFIPERMLAMQCVGGAMHGAVSYSIEPAGENATVSLRSSLKAKFPLHTPTAKSLAADLLRLKALAER